MTEQVRVHHINIIMFIISIDFLDLDYITYFMELMITKAGAKNVVREINKANYDFRYIAPRRHATKAFADYRQLSSIRKLF